MSEPAPTAAPRAWRINGLAFVFLLVAVGLGATAVLYRWRASQLGDEFRRTRSELPQDAALRLERWLEYGRPLMDQRLVQLRYSSAQPWLLTHTVAAERNSSTQEIWGVDMTGLGQGASVRSGLEVVLTLPRARLLGHGPISGDKALNVPHVDPSAPSFDADARARAIVEWSLERLSGALAKDIPGAQLVVRSAEAGSDG